MTIPPFSESELLAQRTVPNYNGPDPIAVYDFPATPREGIKAFYAKKPIWQVMTGFGVETTIFAPRIIPDSIARAHVFDSTTVLGVSNLVGGTDMFGREWVYESDIGGSMVVPGNPLAEDVTELLEKLAWPDVDSWDWEQAAKESAPYFETDNYYLLVFMTGYFERLISLMDFENAIIALISEDDKEAVQIFFERLTDLYINIFEHLFEAFPGIDGISFHDDWGGATDTFFSPSVAAEMIVPHMRRLTDYVHSTGRECDLHSCGNNKKQVENYISAGWDSWTPQPINDTLALYDEYGDRILVATIPEEYDPEVTDEQQQRAYAREYANRVCNPDKPAPSSLYGYIDYPMYTPAFREELYKQSRLNYSRA